MAIHTTMSSADIDKALKAFLDAADEENNDKVLCIRGGELACEDAEEYFSVVELVEESE